MSIVDQPWWDVRMPHDASVDGFRIDDMITETTFFVALMFLITIGWILYSVIRHGEKHPATFDHGAEPKSWRWTVITAALIFFVVDGRLLFGSLGAVHEVYGNFALAESNPDALRVEVNAHQWAWTMRAAGPDGKFNTPDDIVTLNELVIPQGRPIIFELTSTDVIHSFNVPNMRMKVDAVPGQVNRMWFTAKETGTFEIACAQHCGLNHYKMRGVITVLPQDQYKAWAALASTNAEQAFDVGDTEGHWGWDWASQARFQ